jgi:hypothetical protein
MNITITLLIDRVYYFIETGAYTRHAMFEGQFQDEQGGFMFNSKIMSYILAKITNSGIHYPQVQMQPEQRGHYKFIAQ